MVEGDHRRAGRKSSDSRQGKARQTQSREASGCEKKGSGPGPGRGPGIHDPCSLIHAPCAREPSRRWSSLVSGVWSLVSGRAGMRRWERKRREQRRELGASASDGARYRGNSLRTTTALAQRARMGLRLSRPGAEERKLLPNRPSTSRYWHLWCACDAAEERALNAVRAVQRRSTRISGRFFVVLPGVGRGCRLRWPVNGCGFAFRGGNALGQISDSAPPVGSTVPLRAEAGVPFACTPCR